MLSLINKLITSIALLCGIISYSQQIKGQHLYTSRIYPIGEQMDLDVHDLVFDADGFMWLGTSNGLFFSDGLNYMQLFDDSLSDESITSLHVYEQTLIIGYRRGWVAWMDISRKKITQIIQASEYAISKMVVDKDGRLWIGTIGGGLVEFKNGELKNYQKNDGLSDNHINDLLEDSSTSSIWIATDRGLDRLDSNGLKRYSTEDGLPENWILSFSEIQEGSFFIVTHSGEVMQVIYDPYSPLFKSLPMDLEGKTNSVVFPATSTLWLVQDGIELIQLNLISGKLISQTPLNLDDDLQGFVPNGSNQFMTFSKNGEVQVIDQRFTFIDDFSDISTQDLGVVYSHPEMGLFFANDQGLYLWNNIRDGYVVQELMDFESYGIQYAISLFVDDMKRIWVGTFGQGIWILENEEIIHYSEKTGLINDNVLSISGNDNRVWIGTLGGISVFNTQSQRIELEKPKSMEGLKDIYVYTVLALKDKIWFGTEGNGLICFENNAYTTFSSHEDFKSIYSIVCMDSTVWFSSKNGKLNQIFGDSIESYSITAGDKPVELSTLLASNDTSLWFLYDRGLGLFNPRTGKYYLFDDKYGLTNFNYNYLNTLSADSNALWLGLENQLVKAKIEIPSRCLGPRTRLHEIALYSVPIDSSKHSFESRENHFTFKYHGLWYIHPQSIQYRYRIKGFDIDWKYTSENEAVYQKIPPGDYRFEIAAAMNGDFRNASISSWDFSIRRPYYMQSWFILGVIFLILGVGYGFRRAREIKKIRLAQEERDKIQSQFELLKNQVNPHFLFNGLNTLKVLISMDDKQEANTFLIKLSDYLRFLLSKNEQDTHSLKQEMELANDYLFLQQKRFGENLVVNDTIPCSILEEIIIPPLTLQILLENAIKHNVISKSSPLIISLEIKDNYLVVRNNFQPKSQQPEGTGIGLQNIKSRFKILFGKTVIVEQTEKEFVVKLPLVYSTSKRHETEHTIN
jgi:ligand-binding sensor domain-containing protein